MWKFYLKHFWTESFSIWIGSRFHELHYILLVRVCTNCIFYLFMFTSFFFFFIFVIICISDQHQLENGFSIWITSAFTYHSFFVKDFDKWVTLIRNIAWLCSGEVQLNGTGQGIPPRPFWVMFGFVEKGKVTQNLMVH